MIGVTSFGNKFYWYENGRLLQLDEITDSRKITAWLKSSFLSWSNFNLSSSATGQTLAQGESVSCDQNAGDTNKSSVCAKLWRFVEKYWIVFSKTLHWHSFWKQILWILIVDISSKQLLKAFLWSYAGNTKRNFGYLKLWFG